MNEGVLVVKIHLLTMINIFLVATSTIAGIVAGFVIPIRWLGHIAGFQAGVLVGGLIILLGSVMSGLMIGGKLEELYGTEVGVPVGLVTGCFMGAAMLTFLSGLLGALIARLFGH